MINVTNPLTVIVVVVVVATIGYILNKIFYVVIVEGESMMPTYKNGNILFAMKYVSPSQLQIGKVYVFHSPVGRVAIKRLTRYTEISGDKCCFFEGDNFNNSLDSRNYGYVSHHKIIAVVFGGKKK